MGPRNRTSALVLKWPNLGLLDGLGHFRVVRPERAHRVFQRSAVQGGLLGNHLRSAMYRDKCAYRLR